MKKRFFTYLVVSLLTSKVIAGTMESVKLAHWVATMSVGPAWANSLERESVFLLLQ